MKLAFLSLLSFFLFPIISSAKKAPIAYIQFAKDKSDLITLDYFQFGFIITRQDSTVSRTSGFLNGGFPWRKVYIKSDQGHKVDNRRFHFHREAVQMNNNSITLFIQIKEGKIIYYDTVNLRLPKIAEATLEMDSIMPYTSYNKNLFVTMDNQDVFHLSPHSTFSGLKFTDFQLKIPESMIDNGNHFIYSPQDATSLEKINVELSNKQLQFSTTISLNVTSIEKLTIDRSGPHGSDGSYGFDGYDGDDGEDGSNGGDGGDGTHGLNGGDLELLVRNTSENKIQLLVFYQDEIETYFISKNAVISIHANGGNGGDGGYGGDGGDGGGANEFGVCGSDGSDGSDGYGGNGGDGGSVKIFSDMSIKQTAYIFTIENKAGSGGYGLSNGTKGKQGITEYTVLSSDEIEKLFEEYEGEK